MASSSSSSYAGATSRRSHTKSRKGCKTCKRRHIRCDETFPQCRNCSKHQVRCDYMDTAGESSQLSPAPSSDLYWSSDVEAVIDHWQRSGFCSVGETTMNLGASGHIFSKSDLHLIYNALWSGGPNTTVSAEYTVWATRTPAFLAAAADTSFLLHAFLGFGSLALAWERNSSDAKNLAYQQGAIALQGLQSAISAFSQENADAVLAAAILLLWQANDWQSWSSLVAGVRTVVNSMRLWRTESKLTQTIDEQDALIPPDFHLQQAPPHTHEFLINHSHTLESIDFALDRLAPFTSARDEHSLIGELRSYIQRLLSVRPAQTPEEQFNHLYALRKWIFWVPASRLRASPNSYLTLVVLAHLYAIALALEPLFPTVAPAFCSEMSLAPLIRILDAFEDARHNSSMASDQLQSMLSLIAWPEQICMAYRHRKYQASSSYPTSTAMPRPQMGFDTFGQEVGQLSESFNLNHPSPAFQGGSSSIGSRMSSDYGSSHSSPYLGVPSLATPNSAPPQFSSFSSTGAAVSSGGGSSYQSPMLPSMASGFDGSELYNLHTQDASIDMTGFVTPTPSFQLWT